MIEIGIATLIFSISYGIGQRGGRRPDVPRTGARPLNYLQRAGRSVWPRHSTGLDAPLHVRRQAASIARRLTRWLVHGLAMKNRCAAMLGYDPIASMPDEFVTRIKAENRDLG